MKNDKEYLLILFLENLDCINGMTILSYLYKNHILQVKYACKNKYYYRKTYFILN